MSAAEQHHHVATQQQFHIMDGVCVPNTDLFGYVFAISEEENMLLVRSFDGKSATWLHPWELKEFTLEVGVELLESEESL